jgi:Holliday junction DNA helicase RuvB
LGKTTLSLAIASEMGVSDQGRHRPRQSNGLAIWPAMLAENSGATGSFIDEIHRLPRQVEEILYPAMEELCSGSSDSAKAPTARALCAWNLPPFTVVGANDTVGDALPLPYQTRFARSTGSTSTRKMSWRR